MIRTLGPVWGPGQLQPQALHLPGLPQDSWERAKSKAPSPDKQGHLRSTRLDLDA